MSDATFAPQADAHVDSILRIADSSLILGHRLSEWCGHGPVIEEDIALTNVALDLIGQARLLYAYAGALEGLGRSEDDFAFRRDADEFRNVVMVELPNGDYGFTIMRNFLFTAFQRELWSPLRTSPDAELAKIANKSLNETEYHLQHASDWVVRLGDGTDDSRERMRHALEALWPYTAEFFSAGGPDAKALEPRWQTAVRPVLDVATLEVPLPAATKSSARHTEHLAPLLAEMQYLQRTYPNCKW